MIARSNIRVVAQLDCDRILRLAKWHDQLWAFTEKDGCRLWERVPAIPGAPA